MEISSFSSRKNACILLVPCWEDKRAVLAISEKTVLPQISEAIDAKDFTGKIDTACTVYPKGEKEKRILLFGMGKKEDITLDLLRRAYAAATYTSRKHDVKKANVFLPVLPEHLKKEAVRAVAEGLHLSNYHFQKLKSKTPQKLISSFTLIGVSDKELQDAVNAQELIESVHFTRDLVNGNADEVTPSYLESTAKELGKKYKHLSVEIFDRKRIQKEKMGLFLAVSRASMHEPRVIFLSYKGNPKSKDSIAFVGKGITYDTGGLSLKTTSGMLSMKSDMGGAGAVFGIIDAACKLQLKQNIVGVIPTTENSIGSRSYKPGDVYTACNGKTVEITNTDAEGRLALADAIAYTAKHKKPSAIIDLATLTGACIIALGEEFSGLYTDNKTIKDHLLQASEDSGEMIWPLPVYKNYIKLLKSDFADIQNAGPRPGSSITASLFLREFTEDIPWAHLDIAGPAFPSAPFGYNPKYGTGAGVRLIISFLQSLKPSFFKEIR